MTSEIGNENSEIRPPKPAPRKFRRRTPEEVLEQFKELRIPERYRMGEKLERLAAEVGMSPATLWRWLTKLGVKPDKGDTLQIFIDKKIEAQNEIAIKQADLAVSLGLTLVSRYYPYLDYLLAQGKTPEGIIEEMVDWHQRKRETEMKLTQLQMENERLRQELEDLKTYTAPNIRYYIKAEILRRFAENLNRLQFYGELADLSITPIMDLADFYTALNLIDKTPPSQLLEVKKEWLKS